jgi:hypothetical protein
MIFDMASAIARGQTALDVASINLVQVLANTTFDYVPDVVETLSPEPRQVQVMVSGVPHGLTDAHNNPVMVTGVHVDCDVAPSFPLTLLQAGVNPTFYQFTNSTIVVKMSITSTTDTTDTLTSDTTSQGNRDFLFSSGSMTSHVNAAYSGKYSYSVDGSSSLSTTLACVPPPKSILPRFILINAMNPANISVNQS